MRKAYTAVLAVYFILTTSSKKTQLKVCGLGCYQDILLVHSKKFEDMERNNMIYIIEVLKKLLSCSILQMEAQEQQRGHSPEAKQPTEVYAELH